MALEISVKQASDEAIVKLNGELDAASAPKLKETVEQVAKAAPKRLVFDVSELEFMASAGLRVLIFAKQKMGSGVTLYVIGSHGPVLNTLTMSGFQHSVILQDTYAPTE